MVALIAGSANEPIPASVMAIEIFRPEISPYAAVRCVVSFIASSHRSVYPSQILGITKSSSISLPFLMKDLSNINEVDFNVKPGKLIYKLRKFLFRKNKKPDGSIKTPQKNKAT